MKLDHFVDLGIETIWISPFFKSPMQDLGYDVSDYMDIDPTYGTMADFDQLMEEMRKRGKHLTRNSIRLFCSASIILS